MDLSQDGVGWEGTVGISGQGGMCQAPGIEKTIFTRACELTVHPGLEVMTAG